MSKTVDERVKNLWAVLATVAAKKAVERTAEWRDAEGAEKLANTAAKWLERAGANAARYTYRQPLA
jgi:hypothetical protein